MDADELIDNGAEYEEEEEWDNEYTEGEEQEEVGK